MLMLVLGLFIQELTTTSKEEKKNTKQPTNQILSLNEKRTFNLNASLHCRFQGLFETNPNPFFRGWEPDG